MHAPKNLNRKIKDASFSFRRTICRSPSEREAERPAVTRCCKAPPRVLRSESTYRSFTLHAPIGVQGWREIMRLLFIYFLSWLMERDGLRIPTQTHASQKRRQWRPSSPGVTSAHKIRATPKHSSSIYLSLLNVQVHHANGYSSYLTVWHSKS